MAHLHTSLSWVPFRTKHVWVSGTNLLKNGVSRTNFKKIIVWFKSALSTLEQPLVPSSIQNKSISSFWSNFTPECVLGTKFKSAPLNTPLHQFSPIFKAIWRAGRSLFNNFCILVPSASFGYKRKAKKRPWNTWNMWFKFFQIEGIFFRINYGIRGRWYWKCQIDCC